MRSILSALIAGCIFGLGLIISEMVNPKRVQGFLDITGVWDPTLVFVMGGALLFTAIGYKWILIRQSPLYENTFFIPVNRIIDTRLIMGSMLFGAGWGLSGLCPGPAIVGLATTSSKVMAFFIAMIIGMKVFELVDRKTGG